MLQRIVLGLILALILGVPFLMKPRETGGPRRDAKTLVIVTPHVPQIRYEFARAFEAWHLRRFGEHAHVDWRTPGGTSEIVKQLEAQFQAAAKGGRFDFADPKNPTCPPGTIGYDLFFGGGTYDHGRVKRGIVAAAKDVPNAPSKEGEVKISMAQPMGFSQEQLDAWYGENVIGAGTLYDPDQGWLGTALSSFGVVYNKDMFASLGLPEPTNFESLADPRLTGLVALADPRQSGSITTTLDAILSYYGWEKGWRLLREIGANTRYFTSSAPKPPIDVSQGEAAAGLAIDFYGRGQAQATLMPGQDPATSRVGYVDPQGSVYIDADPITMLRGGPSPDLAKRFVEFCLTDEAQALWQFRSLRDPGSASNPVGESGQKMGPERYELRRMPVRRSMYEKHVAHMIDQVDPFPLASTTKPMGWRRAIGPMMGAFSIDNAPSQRAAWKALNRARADTSFDPARLKEMESLFYAFPEHELPDGSRVAFTPENFAKIDKDLRDPTRATKSATAYTLFFRANYERIAELGRP